MSTLKEIKVNLDKRNMSHEDAQWLVNKVEHQKKIIWNLRDKTRFSNYMKMATENLELQEKLQKAEEQRDFYKQAYNLSKTRS